MSIADDYCASDALSFFDSLFNEFEQSYDDNGINNTFALMNDIQNYFSEIRSELKEKEENFKILKSDFFDFKNNKANEIEEEIDSIITPIKNELDNGIIGQILDSFSAIVSGVIDAAFFQELKSAKEELHERRLSLIEFRQNLNSAYTLMKENRIFFKKEHASSIYEELTEVSKLINCGFEDLNKEFENLEEQRVSSISEEIDNIQDRLTRLNEVLESKNEYLETLNNKYMNDWVSNKIDEVSEDIENLEERISKLENRLERLQASIS